MTQLTCARLVTYVYLKLTQMLILKVVSNNSINGLQCYSFRICISPCYGWDTSNGSWGLFWVVFWTCPIKTTPRRTRQYFVLWHKNKATQSVIKLFSEIIDAQCLTNKLAPLAKLKRIDWSVLSGRTEGMIDLYYWVARKEWSIDRSVDNPPPHNFPLVSQWILFCVGSLLLDGRQRDFYMLLNCLRAQNSIIQLPSLGVLQYNNGYWCDQTDQGTSGNLK